MAMLEQECQECEHLWFSNRAEPCPKCGSGHVRTWSDEEPERRGE